MPIRPKFNLNIEGTDNIRKTKKLPGEVNKTKKQSIHLATKNTTRWTCYIQKVDQKIILSENKIFPHLWRMLYISTLLLSDRGYWRDKFTVFQSSGWTRRMDKKKIVIWKKNHPREKREEKSTISLWWWPSSSRWRFV